MPEKLPQDLCIPKLSIPGSHLAIQCSKIWSWLDDELQHYTAQSTTVPSQHNALQSVSLLNDILQSIFC